MIQLSEDFRTLFEGGFTIADECLTRAIRSIDMRFGQGYAKSHPELVATYMSIAAQEFNSSSTQKRQYTLVENSLSRLNVMLEELLAQYRPGNAGKE